MELLLLYCMRMTELYQVDEKYLIDREEETKMMNIGEYRKIEIKVIFHL